MAGPALAEFEEALLSSVLPHPAGFLVVPGVLHPEQAELISAELVERAVDALRRSFRFVLFDLAPQLSPPALTVLEGADNVLLLANAELASLKDLKEARRVLEEVRDAFLDKDAAMLDVMVSPLEGAHGNVEFLAHLRRGAGSSAGVPDLAGIVAEASARQGR